MSSRTFPTHAAEPVAAIEISTAGVEAALNRARAQRIRAVRAATQEFGRDVVAALGGAGTAQPDGAISGPSTLMPA